MTKVDTSLWKEFVFGKIFEMQPQKEISPIYALNNTKKSSIVYPFLGQSSENNCVISYIYLDDESLLNNKESDIVIVIHSNNHLSFCINEPFYLKDGHGATSIFKNIHLNRYNAYFIISVLNKTMEGLFTYDIKATKDSLKKMQIKLPSTLSGEPDWYYMTSFMEKIWEESEVYIENLRQTDCKKKKIDVLTWKDFVIGELFEKIVRPEVLHSRQVTECENGVPYVVRTKFNNGIKCYVKKGDNMKLSPPGVISFGAENANFFYQEESFVSGRDIYYIDTQYLSPLVCKFLVACLQSVARKYSYNNGLFPELLKKEIIKLPVCKDGKNPDWDYMEQYMKDIINKSRNVINSFESLNL